MRKFFELTAGAHEVYVAHARLFRDGSEKNGELVPVGVARAYIQQHRMEIHANWFPWATTRNIVESTVRFLAKMRKEHLILIFAGDETRKFYEHISRYGLLRRVGKIDPYYADGKPAVLFQTPKQKS